MSGDFTPDQKRYLEGFVSGLSAARSSRGVNVFSTGDFLGAPGTEQIYLRDRGLGIYKKLVIADDRLVGAVLFGDTTDGLWYLDLIRSGAPTDRFRNELAFGRAFAERKNNLDMAA